jgi:hypothetical protein
MITKIISGPNSFIEGNLNSPGLQAGVSRNLINYGFNPNYEKYGLNNRV